MWDKIEGLSDEHRSFLTENKFENPAQLVEKYREVSAGAKAWHSGLDEKTKGMLESKGFSLDRPEDLVTSYLSLEKMKGAGPDKLIRLPDSDDDKAGWGAVFSKLGRPEKADEYGLDGEIAGHKMDAETANWAKSTFHELGLTKAQAQKLAAKWVEQWQNVSAATEERTRAERLSAESALKNRWAANYDKNVHVAQNAAKEFGVDAETFEGLRNALGTARTAEIFYNIAQIQGEDKYIAGNYGNPRYLTPRAAEAKISELGSDSEFMAKWQAGDSGAREKMEHLHRLAFGGAE
jgi:hypothetical protein